MKSDLKIASGVGAFIGAATFFPTATFVALAVYGAASFAWGAYWMSQLDDLNEKKDGKK